MFTLEHSYNETLVLVKICIYEHIYGTYMNICMWKHIMTNNTITMKDNEAMFLTGLKWSKRKKNNAIML